MTRRLSRLRALALAACALTSLLAAARTRPAQPPPPASTLVPAEHPRNIVFVLLDDLRYDVMGFLKPGLNTPNIDFLARNGVYFPNAVVTSSLCSPSRATILTGMTTRNHGVVDNNNSSEAGLVFFPSYLQRQGYQTGFFGKWHMGNDTDAPRPGFDKWVSFKGQGTYFATDGLTPQQIAAGRRQTLNVDGKVVDRKGYITDELTDYALDWLEHGRDRSKPFFLYLSHKAVHADALPPDRYKTQYAGLDIAMPASMADTPENYRGKPKWVRDQRNSWHGVDFPYYTQDQMSERVRDIYRTLSPVDESLGKLLAYLRKEGIEKDTLIVFTSDNGFLYGDHGLIDKRNAYEPSIRVPMLVYAPGLLPKGAVNPALIRNLDIAPTLLDVAHVAKPPQMEGRSWLEVAEGKKKPGGWNPGDFVYEYYWEWNFPQTPTTFAIERDRVKYIQYHGVWDTEELYDLSKDPDEMDNRIDDPAYAERKAALRRALFAQLANAKGQHVVPFTLKTNPGTVDRNVGGAKPGDYSPSWYVQPKAAQQ